MAGLLDAVARLDEEDVRAALKTGVGQLELDCALAHLCWYQKLGEWGRRKSLADLVLAAGANVNGVYRDGYGPVVLGACECLEFSGLRYLVERGADVKFAPVMTKYGMTSPVVTVLSDYTRGRQAEKQMVLDYLLAQGAWHVDDAFLAIHRGSTRRLGELLKKDPALPHRKFESTPYVDLPGTTLLHTACDQGEVECVELLIERGADVNARGAAGETPVWYAVGSWRGGNHPVLHLLSSRFADRVDWAVRTKEGRTLFDRLDAEAKVEWKGITPEGYERENELLMKMGVPSGEGQG
jgi:hypothetical protein